MSAKFKVQVVSRAMADTDYTIGYDEAGQPVAVAEEADGGFYGVVEAGEYVVNTYEGRCWYLDEGGKWASVTGSSVDGMTRRDINDGAQDVYDGNLVVI